MLAHLWIAARFIHSWLAQLAMGFIATQQDSHFKTIIALPDSLTIPIDRQTDNSVYNDRLAIVQSTTAETVFLYICRYIYIFNLNLLKKFFGSHGEGAWQRLENAPRTLGA